MSRLSREAMNILLPHLIEADYWQSPIAGLSVYMRHEPTVANTYMQSPSMCLVLQGEKTVQLGAQTYTYDQDHYICYGMTLPITAHITKASSDAPYIGLMMQLDEQKILDTMLQMQTAYDSPENPTAKDATPAYFISDLPAALASAFERLVKLVDCPEDIEFLAPLLEKEIYYLLMSSPQGNVLRQLATQDSHSQQIAKATTWMQQHYREPVEMERLAARIGMSISSFYQHFKRLTEMTPLQYQKSLRLLEARRLILLKTANITHIATEVGYESPSQFSREYKRYFEISPKQDWMAV